MGSFFGGIKAGTLSGILYVGGLAAFNVVLLYALKADVLTSISQANPVSCPMAPNVNGSAQDCFDLVVSVSVPFVAFVTFLVTFILAGFFGYYFDSLPTKSATAKGLAFGALVALSILFGVPLTFGVGLIYIFDFQSLVATVVFLLAWTPVFGYFLGRLYRKYTRVVGFESQDPALLKVVVDGRDYTGKRRTFATTSNHRLRAQVEEGASFREWEGAGGVSLEDPRSFETVMEVNDDGTVKGKVTGKY